MRVTGCNTVPNGKYAVGCVSFYLLSKSKLSLSFGGISMAWHDMYVHDLSVDRINSVAATKGMRKVEPLSASYDMKEG